MSAQPVVRGEPWLIPVAVFDANGDPADVSAWTITASIIVPHTGAEFNEVTIADTLDLTEGTFFFAVAADADVQTEASEGQLNLLLMIFAHDDFIERRSVNLDIRVAEHRAVTSADSDLTLV